jgi:hypothetical protein
MVLWIVGRLQLSEAIAPNETLDGKYSETFNPRRGGERIISIRDSTVGIPRKPSGLVGMKFDVEECEIEIVNGKATGIGLQIQRPTFRISSEGGPFPPRAPAPPFSFLRRLTEYAGGALVEGFFVPDRTIRMTPPSLSKIDWNALQANPSWAHCFFPLISLP